VPIIAAGADVTPEPLTGNANARAEYFSGLDIEYRGSRLSASVASRRSNGRGPLPRKWKAPN